MKMRKLVAMLLAVLMLCSIIPFSAAAAGETYVKITSAAEFTSGTYVMVTDTGNAPGVLDGSWVTAVQPTVSGNAVTDAKGGVWTLTVNGDSVTIQDANGVSIAPKGGNNNGIITADYAWVWACADGKFTFSGNGSDTVLLASNAASENKFRAYKSATVSGNPAGYPSQFTLYKLEGDAPSTPDVPVTPDPEPDVPAEPDVENLTIADAIALGQTFAHNTFSENKYYVTGVITEVYNTQYGNMKITDDAGNILTIYGTYSADGSTRYDALEVKPVAGDTVTIYGIVGQYNGTSQVKNGWIVAHTASGDTPVTPDPEPDVPAVGTVVTNPVAGVAYKFGMIQSNVSATDVYYLKGGMNGYYMDTAADVSVAIDVYLEETIGGYYMYTLVDGAKTYINMVVSGTHVNGAYEAAASTVYTYNTESNTVIAVVDDKEYWFGTRNDKNYTTVGPCAVEYAGFYCQFYAVSGGDTPVNPDPDTPVDPDPEPEPDISYPIGYDAYIDFTDIANRVAYSAEQQVWELEGVTVTNDKGASTSDVGDYGGSGYPARFYKSSTVTIEYPGMVELSIECVGLESKYVNGWIDSIADDNVIYAQESGGFVVIQFAEPVDSFTWEVMSAQSRAYRIYVFAEENGDTPVDPEPDQPIYGGAIYVDAQSAYAGDTVIVPVRVDNNPGIVSAKVKVYFDNTLLEFVSAVEGNFSATGYSWGDPDTVQEKGYVIINWCDATKPDSMADLLATLTFKVKDDAVAGFTTLAVEFNCEADVFNAEDKTVYFDAVSGGVDILEAPAVILGDANGDGKVNNRDLGILQQYLNEWEVSVDDKAADVNDDGKVNNRDLGILQRMLNE